MCTNTRDKIKEVHSTEIEHVFRSPVGGDVQQELKLLVGEDEHRPAPQPPGTKEGRKEWMNEGRKGFI